MAAEMRMWAIHHPDGSFEQVFDNRKPTAPLGARVIEIDRFGVLSLERHDPAKGWVARDPDVVCERVDACFDADYPAHRLLDHAVKEIEAHIVLGTLTSEGRLAREARLRGISIEDLARAVLSAADAHRPDAARIEQKLKFKGEIA